MALFDSVWLCLSMFDSVWLYMALFDSVWLCMTLYNSVWHYAAMHKFCVCFSYNLLCRSQSSSFPSQPSEYLSECPGSEWCENPSEHWQFSPGKSLYWSHPPVCPLPVWANQSLISCKIRALIPDIDWVLLSKIFCACHSNCKVLALLQYVSKHCFQTYKFFFLDFVLAFEGFNFLLKFALITTCLLSKVCSSLWNRNLLTIF